MYHIAILDDERKEAEHIKELADVYFDRKELMQRRIDIFHNGNELWHACNHDASEPD